ncbi:putative baseplate assembly protein [Sorangium sp. So ce341]|uniref:putative baseplate assembly protein n=1 Tax=Sorangium sp. So ce341 TaxID=3133302 RepID=UPI003F60D5CF
MPISLPNLDDRRWSDLVEEGRALLPLRAPGWTDHNASDPGITLIELLAWLAEQDIYRLNRITARHRTKFLELVEGLPRPPRAARGVLAMRLRDPDAQPPVSVPATTEFELPSGGLTFRTLYPLRVGGLSLRALQVGDGTTWRALDSEAPEGFLPFGDDPQVGAALYLGFDRPLPPGERTSLYVPMARGEGDDAALRSRRSLRRHHSVETVWELRDATGSWRPLKVRDGTRAWTRQGHLWLEGPAQGMQAARLGSVTEPLHYVRCRVTAGRFDVAPRIHGVLCDAVEVEQARALHGVDRRDGIAIGRGDGSPHQRFALPDSPVVRSSLRVWSVASDGSAQAWHARADLAASTPADRHFVLDPTRGELFFGDGRTGRAPEPGQRLFVTFRATAAERGLVRPQPSLRLADSPHNRALDVNALAGQVDAAMPLSSWGGAAAESLGQAIERAADAREARSRAVTLADYEELARTTPGVRIERAHAIANHHPAFDCIKAPGLITVIVVPGLPRRRPQPSAGLRAAVRAWLAPRRVLGTRVEVVGPTYLEVEVHARVRLLEKQRPERVQRAIVSALDRFLDPLRGGPDGGGWPFGRDVYRAEILQTIDDVPGVDHVLELSLVPAGCAPICGNLCLKPTWLTTPGAHHVEVV